MQNKSYTATIEIDLNTVSCPGVYLCPKGKAFLKVCLFGIADLTRDVNPFFPLTIRERFIFKKDFRNISSVYELHDKIERSVISIQLLQCPVGSPGCVKLAIFNSLLTDLLHPYSTCFAKPPDVTGIELLFTTCKIFPGIIAPKADVSVKVAVSDTRGESGKPTVRRIPLKLRKGDQKRQKPVCHSKNGLNCGCFSKPHRQPGGQNNDDSDERRNDGGIEPKVHATHRARDFHPGIRETKRFSESQKLEPHVWARRDRAETPVKPKEGESDETIDVQPLEPSDTDEPSMEWAHKGSFAYGNSAITNEMDTCEKLLEGFGPNDHRIDPMLKLRYDNCVASIVRQRMNDEGLMQSAPKPKHIAMPCHGKCCKCEEKAEKSEIEGLPNENEAETFEMRRDRSPGRLPTTEEAERVPLKSYYKSEKERVRKREYESITREKYRNSQLKEIREQGRSGRNQRNTQDDHSQRPDDHRSSRQQRERVRRNQGSLPGSDSSEDHAVNTENIQGTHTRGRSAGDQNGIQPVARRPQSTSQGQNVKRPTVSKLPRPIPGQYDRGGDRGLSSQVTSTSAKKPSTEPQLPRNIQRRPQSPEKTRRDDGDSSGECDCNICEQYQELYNPTVHPCPRYGMTGKKNRQKSPTRPITGSKKVVSSRQNAHGTLSKQPPRKFDRDRNNEECGVSTCDGPIDIEAIEEMNAIQKFYYGK